MGKKLDGRYGAAEVLGLGSVVVVLVGNGKNGEPWW